jgi:glutamate synthase domain-containing protein 1
MMAEAAYDFFHGGAGGTGRSKGERVMCRIGSIKSKVPVHPSKALHLMLPQQEGHDNSGFAMVMQDLYGIFSNYKDKPLLSLACTQAGAHLVEEYMDSHNFVQLAEWIPVPYKEPGLDIQAMPYYIFRNYDYPEHCDTKEEREELLLDTRLALRKILEDADAGYVYSFWPDVLTLKEIGDPRDIATYFRLWDDNGCLVAKNIIAQCRQNTNYDIVRYAAHPFFLQGYTLCANGENTFYTKNKEFQKSLHRGYIGFESDSQNFLYTLHYVLHELKWPLPYYKHVITPLPFAEIDTREDKAVLRAIRQSLANLEINGPNTIIAGLPDGRMMTCCDSKKLRPVVLGGDDTMVAISSEVCGLNEILPDRDMAKDIYPNEREIVVIDNELEVQRWKQ